MHCYGTRAKHSGIGFQLRTHPISESRSTVEPPRGSISLFWDTLVRATLSNSEPLRRNKFNGKSNFRLAINSRVMLSNMAAQADSKWRQRGHDPQTLTNQVTNQQQNNSRLRIITNWNVFLELFLQNYSSFAFAPTQRTDCFATASQHGQLNDFV